MNRTVVALVFIFLSGCSHSDKEGVSEKKSNVHTLYALQDHYFGNSMLFVRDDFAMSSTYNALSSIEISKHNMDINLLFNLQNKLMSDGWSSEGQKYEKYQYCYGRNYYLELIPPLESAEAFNGNLFYPVSKHWTVGFQWSRTGFSSCLNFPEKDIKNIIK